MVSKQKIAAALQNTAQLTINQHGLDNTHTQIQPVQSPMTRFSKLPTELRLLIWSFVQPLPGIIKIGSVSVADRSLIHTTLQKDLAPPLVSKFWKDEFLKSHDDLYPPCFKQNFKYQCPVRYNGGIDILQFASIRHLLPFLHPSNTIAISSYGIETITIELKPNSVNAADLYDFQRAIRQFSTGRRSVCTRTCKVFAP
jgi:hypothetical protein